MPSSEQLSLYADPTYFRDPSVPSTVLSMTRPVPGLTTTVGNSVEKDNQDNRNRNTIPTYSTWVIRNGELVPIQPRSPSPTPPPPSSARREFDERIRAAREDRIWNGTTGFPRANRRAINAELEWRTQQIREEQSNQLWNKPYYLLAPWPLEMRMRCADYVDLLDEYYKYEETTRRTVEYQLAHYGLPQNQWQINEQEIDEIAHLTKLQKALEEDRKADNDFKVLSKVLDNMEKAINERTGMTFRRGAQLVPGHLVSDLPEYVLLYIGRDPRLQKKLEHLTATELANLVASANIQSTGPEITEIGLDGNYAGGRGEPDMSDDGESHLRGEQDDNKKNWQMDWW